VPYLKVVEENGKEVVDHSGSVAIVAVDTQRQVWLVRQWRQPARAQLLELPAGTREQGEEPLETAKRELASGWTTPGFVREHMTLFLAEGVEPRGEQDLDESEDVQIVKWPVDEIAQRLGELDDVKTQLGLLLYLRDQD